MNRRWLITGGDGQLAKEFLRVLSHHHENVISLNRSECDLENLPQIELNLKKYQPTHILNCAAWTDVEGAESEPSRAQAVNAQAPRHIALVSKEIGAFLVHFSTDYVFDGLAHHPYQTTDIKNPQSVYGLSKAAGEDFIRDIIPDNSLIIRTSWLYSVFGRNFVKKILELEKSKETLSVVNDQTGQPTWCADIALFTFNIVTLERPVGIFHLTNSGSTTWFDFAQKIFTLSGKDPQRIQPVNSQQFPQKAKRPVYSVLDNSNWQTLGYQPLRSWEQALTEFMATNMRDL